MAYILFRKRPNAAQQFNTYLLASKINERAEGSREKAEKILAKTYFRSISLAAETQSVVAVIPPSGEGLWSWNRSFDIACDAASQYEQAEVRLLVPTEADIFIGKEYIDMTDEEERKALEALNFDFSDENSDIWTNDDDDIELDEDEHKWLGDIDEQFAKMMENTQSKDKKENNAEEGLSWEEEAENIANIVENTHPQFGEYLKARMKERGLTPARLARRSNLVTSTIVHLVNNDIIVPTKSQIMAIGMALELEREEFEEMMLLVGYVFSDSVPRDVIVSYYLDHKIYNIEQINRALFINDIPTLGTHMPVLR